MMLEPVLRYHREGDREGDELVTERVVERSQTGERRAELRCWRVIGGDSVPGSRSDLDAAGTAVGVDPRHLAKTTVYVKDWRPELVEDLHAAVNDYVETGGSFVEFPRAPSSAWRRCTSRGVSWRSMPWPSWTEPRPRSHSVWPV
jgi:hypothetical protein